MRSTFKDNTWVEFIRVLILMFEIFQHASVSFSVFIPSIVVLSPFFFCYFVISAHLTSYETKQGIIMCRLWLFTMIHDTKNTDDLMSANNVWKRNNILIAYKRTIVSKHIIHFSSCWQVWRFITICLSGLIPSTFPANNSASSSSIRSK